MTQSEKHLAVVLGIALIILSVLILTPNKKQMPSQEKITVGYHCSTVSSESTQTQNGDTTTSVRTYTHSIYTSEGNKLTDLTVTVSGITSPSECAVSHISALLTDQQWDGLTVSEHTAADTGTVILFQDQLSVCHFQYRISPGGEICYL